MDINKVVMRFAGDDRYGDGQACPPEAKPFRYRIGHGKVYPLKDKSSGYQIWRGDNDGFELWMGWDRHWDHHLRQEEVRALFWYLLFEWFMKARWFGLRRPIYYWALKRHVRQFQQITK